MPTVKLQHVRDVIALGREGRDLDHVEVDARTLARHGVLRHAFKYALWALRVGGTLEVRHEPSRSASFSTRRIDLWQVRHELFKSVGADLVLEHMDPAGTIRLRKAEETYVLDGLSIGTVFSGNEAELPLLTRQFESVRAQLAPLDKPLEWLVCGPGDFDGHRLQPLAGAIPLRYLSLSGMGDGDRALIGRKKNTLLRNASHDAVALCHSRILFGPDAIAQILRKKFDAFTPAVWYDDGGRLRRYLDYTLVGSYDLSRPNPRKVLVADSLPAENLYHLRRRVPFIDGGLVVLNRRHVPPDIYSDRLAWGEAEDVDMCANLDHHGCLIDLDSRIRCFSQTNKLRFRDSPIAPLRLRLLHALTRRGLA